MVERSTFETGRLLRLGKLGKLGAKAAGTKLLGNAGHKVLATALAKELGQMKGLPMKIGQLFSYMDGLVPEDQRDMYAEVLGVLRASAPAVDNAGCLALLEEELGGSRAELFERFDDVPIASASLGQVYRARFDGREVCVKVQYPGIAEATVSDIANLDAIFSVARRLLPGAELEGLVENFIIRLEGELDYVEEAAFQRRFAEVYAGDPDILVPDVVDARSTMKVLTTVRIEGMGLDAFLLKAGQEERDRAGRALFRFAFGSLLQHGLFHADPHPGNLLFRADGERLGVLDYGCVQPFGEEQVQRMAALVEAAAERRPLREPVREAFELTADDFTLDTLTEVVGLILRPISDPQPFLFTRDFARDISKRVMEAKLQLNLRMLTGRARFASTADGLMFIARNLFGLANIWGQLGCRGDFRGETLAFLETRRRDPDRGG